MKFKKLSLVILLFEICLGVTLGVTINNTKALIDNNYENNQRLISSIISNSLNGEVLRAITVAETMSKDITTKNILSSKTKEEAVANEEEARQYLNSLRSGFGYSKVFAVSDGSKAYYTSDGLVRYVDVNDKADEWYNIFVSSKKDYSLDVDTEVTFKSTLSIFVNTAVYDENKNFIGICGVGVEMSEFQYEIERYERIYDVEIKIVNEAGLVQVSTDTSLIEIETIKVDNLSEYKDGISYYELNEDGNRTITYLDDMDWYLIVKDSQVVKKNLMSVILPEIICIALGGIALIGILIVNYTYKRKEN